MSSDLSWAAMYSLKAADAWIGTLNSNMMGSTRTAYKNTSVTFGGGGQSVLRAPAGRIAGLQCPDVMLQAKSTTIDFSQGSIVTSTEDTHVGIQGNGFFPVLASGTVTGAGNDILYTRDGEFHVARDTAGNYVLANTQGLILAEAGATPGTANTVSPVIDAARYSQYGVDLVAGKYGDGTNIVDSGGTAWNIYHSLVTFQNLQGLKFSKYGSTIYEPGINTTYGAASTATVIGSSLEASNASMNQTVPELSSAQKMYSAISKIYSVLSQNIDTVTNLIR